MKTRVLIADDHCIVRSGIRALLAERNDLDIVGEANDGLSAIRMNKKLKPGLILMDIGMPDMNGIAAIKEITREHKDVRVMVLSMHSDDKMVARALKAGAKGYLIKNCDPKELNTAIDSVISGKLYISMDISQSLLQNYIDKLTDDASVACILTLREREMLQMIAEGKSMKDIANIHNISVKTVEVHKSKIMSKLNIHSIAELTKYAIREGLTQIH